MTKENRFSNLMGQVGKAKQSDQVATSKTGGKVTKSKSSDYQKITLYLTKDLAKRLKMAGLEAEMELSDMAEEAIEQWLSSRSDD